MSLVLVDFNIANVLFVCRQLAPETGTSYWYQKLVSVYGPLLTYLLTYLQLVLVKICASVTLHLEQYYVLFSELKTLSKLMFPPINKSRYCVYAKCYEADLHPVHWNICSSERCSANHSSITVPRTSTSILHYIQHSPQHCPNSHSSTTDNVLFTS